MYSNIQMNSPDDSPEITPCNCRRTPAWCAWLVVSCLVGANRRGELRLLGSISLVRDRDVVCVVVPPRYEFHLLGCGGPVSAVMVRSCKVCPGRRCGGMLGHVHLLVVAAAPRRSPRVPWWRVPFPALFADVDHWLRSLHRAPAVSIAPYSMAAAQPRVAGSRHGHMAAPMGATHPIQPAGM